MEFRWIYGTDKIDLCYHVRKIVFVDEQGFAGETEYDNFDQVSYHLEVMNNNEIVATARVFKEHETDTAYHCGRICILKEYRGTGLGLTIMEQIKLKAIELKATALELSAQVRAKEFYAKAGYTEYGETYLDEGCPHVMMKLEL